MPKNSHVQIELATPNTTPATYPAISMGGSPSTYGIATLTLACVGCTVKDITDQRDYIIQRVRDLALLTRAKLNPANYEPQRHPLESFAGLVQPVRFGVCIDVVALSDDDIVDSADQIMEALIENFERVGNATQATQGGDDDE